MPPWRGRYVGFGGNGLEQGESLVEVGVESEGENKRTKPIRDST